MAPASRHLRMRRSVSWSLAPRSLLARKPRKLNTSGPAVWALQLFEAALSSGIAGAEIAARSASAQAQQPLCGFALIEGVRDLPLRGPLR